MPKVSVIIPTYNRATLIGNAIRSVQAQSFSDWEIIVVDDGSTDDTRQVVEKMSEPRLHYVWQPNQGSSAARNIGVQWATSHYLAFLDSDDDFLPDKLRAQVAFLDEHPGVGLVAGGSIEVLTREGAAHATQREVRPWSWHPHLSLHTWLRACPFSPGAVLMQRDWFNRVGGFDREMRYVEDWDFWLRLAYAGCRMAWQKELVCHYYLHENNKVRGAKLMLGGTFVTMDKFFAQPNLPADILAQRDAVYANAHLDAAVRCIAANLIEDGHTHLATALKLDASLQQDRPPRLIRSLASAAISTLVTDVQAFITSACAALSGLPARMARSPRQFVAVIEASRAFDHLANQRRVQAQRAAARAIWLDPAWLRDRGLLRILSGV